MDVPDSCSAEAAVLCAGYNYHYFDNRAVEAWSDRWIAQLDEPPTELLDLSILSESNPVDVIKLLERIASDRGVLLSAELGLVGVLHERQQRSLKTLIRGLYQLVYSDELDEKVKSTIYQLDDGIDLAEQGIYGTIEEVEKEFACLVRPYAKKIQADFPDLFS